MPNGAANIRFQAWFDEGTRLKVHVLGRDPGPTLRELIDADNLPKVCHHIPTSLAEVSNALRWLSTLSTRTSFLLCVFFSLLRLRALPELTRYSCR